MPTPPSEPHRPFRLRLVHDSELPLLGEYRYDEGLIGRSRSAARGPEDAALPHDIRYTINAYGLTRAGEWSRSADTTIVFTRPSASGLDAEFELEIPDGDYRMMVWTDYVDAGTTSDKYYRTDDFEEIILGDRNAHSGSNPWRDAFAGSAETSVVSRNVDGGAPSRTPVDEATVEMARPMARYSFVSTDLRRFIEQTSRGRGRSGEPSRAPALEEYVVRMVYTRYMPCSFNMFTNRPADSWVGVSYGSRIRRLNDDEAEIAFDYVFVNGTETAVTVAVEVYDSDGTTLLARIPPFDVPLKRSRHTIVKGDFLTTRAEGSTGICPDFDGEFNIFIP